MDNSKALLGYAIQALNEAGLSEEDWSIGGGTVLRAYYNHRISKDIDIFISDVQLLSRLSPRINSVTEEALDYNEISNYFIVANMYCRVIYSIWLWYI